MSVSEHLTRLETAYRSEQRWLARLNALSWAISLGAVCLLLTLLFVFQRASPWLVLLTVFGMSTRLSSIIVHYSFLYPAFLLSLDSEDPDEAAAARQMLEARRETTVRSILRERMVSSSDQAVAATTAHQLAAWAREWNIPLRHRRLRRFLIAYAVVAASFVATLVATRGAYEAGGAGW